MLTSFYRLIPIGLSTALQMPHLKFGTQLAHSQLELPGFTWGRERATDAMSAGVLFKKMVAAFHIAPWLPIGMLEVKGA
jgi:hypothetical protein